MSRPVWITPGGNLGTFPELEFYTLPLQVANPTGSPVAFTFLSGELPPGLQVVRAGILQGVPVVLDPKPDAETRTYKFTIRASCQTPVVVVDRTFSFTVSNIQPPVIVPEETLLGEFFDGTKIDIALDAIEANPSAVLTWTVKDGALPPGVALTEAGVLTGFIGQAESITTSDRLGYDAKPTQVQVLFAPGDNVTAPDNQYFAGNAQPYRLETQTPFGSPQLYQELPYDYSTSLSTNKNYTFTVQVFDGAKYDTQTYTIKVISKGSWSSDNAINTIDDNIITTDADQLYVPIITTAVTSLPNVRENSNFAFKFSAIDYYNTPALYWSSPDMSGNTNIANLIPGLTLDSTTGWLSGHIGNQTDYKQTYTFYVTAANNTPGTSVITATYIAGGYSNTNLIVNSTTGIRAGMYVQSNVYTNSQQVLRVFSANNTLEISSVAAGTPAGNITFNGTLTSAPVEYQLTVLGDVNNKIVWDTDSLVGTIVNGSVSELTIDAHSTLYVDEATTPGKEMVYKIVHGTAGDGSAITDAGYDTPMKVSLPQGLELLPSGHIAGRASFRHFQLDAGTTSIDGSRTNFDTIYTFTVQAESVDQTVSDEKTFTIKVSNLYETPYENLYMKALTTLEQRRLFNDILKDPTEGGLFPDDLIYRLDDPNFGKSKDIKFLAVPGVAPSSLGDYISAMQKNFQNKTIKFSEIKTAIATDPNNNYAIKYEVVYADIVDPFNPDNADVAIETNLYSTVNHIANPYYGPDGTEYHILNPNTFDNMETRISQNLGYSAQGVIPDWMTSVQEDKTVLGFKRAIVLAYTKPGAAKKIAWRVQNKGITLDTINFTADRYVLDNILSAYYNVPSANFDSSRQTTFDYLTLVDSTSFDVVNYAAEQTFASINNQLISYINDRGGIDGVTTFRDGDRLVFAKQENFTTDFSNDGWVYYRDLFVGNYSDATDDVDTAYFDSAGFDSSYIIPGYIEKAAKTQEPVLTGAVTVGDQYIYVPYIVGVNYVGKMIKATSFIDDNTVITNQVADNSTGTLSWKLTLSRTTVGTTGIGTTIKVESYLTVTAVDGNVITVNPASFPSNIGDKLALIENAVSGYGIPAGSRIANIVGNVITLENYDTAFTTSIRAGDLMGYYVENQRSGIWEVQVNETANTIRLQFVKELSQGSVVKVLDGRSHSLSFLQYSHSIESGHTVPDFNKVPNVITFNGADGGRTSFDSNGTKFFDNRDLPAHVPPPIPDAWVANTYYPVGSQVKYQNQYYRATTNVAGSAVFQTGKWEKYNELEITGETYLKFPQLNVFN